MPRNPEDALLARLNAAAPEGLTFLGVLTLSVFVTPVLELSRLARWRWPCPPELRHLAENKLATFESSSSFSIEKIGKEGGQKRVKHIEVRALVQSIAWERGELTFTTRISAKEATNPMKLLGGILGLEPGAITGLERLDVELAEDPRLDQADRFEPKLRNIYEDAVLLSAGPNLKIIDEDEDEPLKIG